MNLSQISRSDAEKTECLPLAVLKGKLKYFVPLPSDPSVPLTQEQLDVPFPQEHRSMFVRGLARLEAEELEVQRCRV